VEIKLNLCYGSESRSVRSSWSIQKVLSKMLLIFNKSLLFPLFKQIAIVKALPIELTKENDKILVRVCESRKSLMIFRFNALILIIRGIYLILKVPSALEQSADAILVHLIWTTGHFNAAALSVINVWKPHGFARFLNLFLDFHENLQQGQGIYA
jgi:hypothetical protein